MEAERKQAVAPSEGAPVDARVGSTTVVKGVNGVEGADGADGAAAATPASLALERAAMAARVAGRWLRANSWLPVWFPARWRHWGVAYLIAALSQVVAVGVIALIHDLIPAFFFQGSLEILVIVFVALTFGPGPSLLATFLGAVLLDYFALPPRFSWTLSSVAYLISLALFIVTGCVASILASQTERARSVAEAAREHAERVASALDDERALLDAVFEATPDRISIFDEQGRLVRQNAAAKRAAGPERGAEGLLDLQLAYSLRRLSGEPWPAEELPLTQALRGENTADGEMFYRDSEGRDQIILTSAAPIRDAGGQIRGAIGVAHDITALREAQREAVERASLLEAIIESIADPIFVYDTQGGILRTNAAARKLFAFDAQPDYSALSLSERLARVETGDAEGNPLPVEQSPQYRVLRGETLAGDAATDYRLRVLDGREVMVNVSGAPVRSDDGRMYGGILILRDVTERRALQRRTRESLDAVLAMAQTLVELPPATQDGQDSQDGQDGQDGQDDAPRRGLEVPQRIAYLTCRVLGCARVAIIGIESETKLMRAIAIVGLPPEQERQWWAEQRESARRGARFGEGGDPTDIARLLAGETIVLDMTRPPYADLPNPYNISTSLFAPMLIGSQVIGVLGLDYGGPLHTFTDDEMRLASAVAQLGAVVLERDRLLRERAEAQANLLAAQETNRRMDEFLSIASHELKTPITTVHANLQLIERRMGRLDEELARLDRLDRLDGAADTRIKPLIESFHALLRRADSATMRQNRLVQDLLDVSRFLSGKLDLKIETCDLVALVRDCVEDQRLSWPDRTIAATLPEEPEPVAADGDRIAQVVTNFLTNALKYSPDDAPVMVALTREGGMARVSVTDRGPGIPEEEQPRLWERFYRAPGIETQSGSGVGLGLGLYISHEIIERHGGRIGVESQPGDGSTFWFTLPLTSD